MNHIPQSSKAGKYPVDIFVHCTQNERTNSQRKTKKYLTSTDFITTNIKAFISK